MPLPRYSRLFLSQRRGFTLVELLVVIGIIFLLAAILLPVFASVREKGRRSVCQSNLKQMGLAFEQYAQDYDERYPTVYIGFDGNINNMWMNTQSYIKSQQIFYCPSDPAFTDCIPSTGCTTTNKEISYGFNVGPAWNSNDGATLGGVYGQSRITRNGDNGYSSMLGTSLAEVESASQTFVASDAYDYGFHSMDPTAYFHPPMPQTESEFRHHDWRNVLFADGHVKAIQWHTGLDANNSNADNTAIMLPRDTSYYDSYCVNPDKLISYPTSELVRCGDVVPQIAKSVTSWLPE